MAYPVSMNSAFAGSPLVVIVGPTASGKSSLGVSLARKFGGEVVACDSTQLYRGFDIGTAKPSEEERQRIPHHLLDVLNPDEPATAGAYRERAEHVLHDLKSRGRVPVFTVGTGLYLRALLEGFADLPQRSEEIRERLRTSAEDHGPGYLHRVLSKFDPTAAAKIARADEQKLIRAIEVCMLARRPLSEVHLSARQPLLGWTAIKIGLQPRREALIQAIHARTESMLSRGWLEEVRQLLEQGFPESAKPFDFIGYRELRRVLQKKDSQEHAQAAIQQATRQYARRQMTWFRREKGVHWLAGFGGDPEIQNAAAAHLESCSLAPARGPEFRSV
jgi:tRNA dimethylallyltransferase